jgi:hypothetical protein
MTGFRRDPNWSIFPDEIQTSLLVGVDKRCFEHTVNTAYHADAAVCKDVFAALLPPHAVSLPSLICFSSLSSIASRAINGPAVGRSPPLPRRANEKGRLPSELVVARVGANACCLARPLVERRRAVIPVRTYQRRSGLPE